MKCKRCGNEVVCEHIFNIIKKEKHTYKMKQMKFSNELQVKPKLHKEYSKGSYNKIGDEEQWIRISEGCPNDCEFCRETFENGVKPIYYNIPNIERNSVKIMDMNLLYKPKCIEILNELGNKKVSNRVVYYELICGIDYRFMTQEKANALKNNRFKNIRLAWDHQITEQKKIKQCINYLLKAGYKSKEIMIFMVCNWKISYDDNLFKLDLCKIWNVKVADCYFDNQLSPNIKPIHWSIENIKNFRKKCRTHNQMVLFGIDPELDKKVHIR
jgi:hypothetical protein